MLLVLLFIFLAYETAMFLKELRGIMIRIIELKIYFNLIKKFGVLPIDRHTMHRITYIGSTPTFLYFD